MWMIKYIILLFNNRKPKRIILYVIILVLSIIFFFIPKVLDGKDDINYLRLASSYFLKSPEKIDINNNIDIISTNIFQFRILYISIIGLLTKIFGIKEITILLVSFLSTIATCILLFAIQKNKKNDIIIYTLVLYAFNYPILYQSFAGTPDTLLVLIFTACYYAFFLSRNKYSNNIFLGSILAVLLFLGFLIKETIIFIAPLLLFFFVYDLFIKKENFKFWISTFFTSLLFLTLYFLYYKIAFGNPLYRLDIYSNNQYCNFCSYNLLPASELLKRLTLGIPFIVISTASISIAISTILLLYKLLKTSFNINTSNDFHLVSFGILILTANFFPISTKHYIPLCLETRNFLFIVPISSLIAASYLSKSIDTKKIEFSIILFLLFLVSIIILYLKEFQRKDYDVSIALLFFYLALFVIKFIPYKQKLYPFIFVIISFSLFNLYIIVNMKHRTYSSYKSLLNSINITSENIYIYGRENKNMADFFLNFQCKTYNYNSKSLKKVIDNDLIIVPSNFKQLQKNIGVLTKNDHHTIYLYNSTK